MKIVARNISLSEELDRFAVAEAEEGGYGSVSAYFADLLRQRRQAQIDEDLKLLTAAVREAPPGSEPMDDIVAACKAARREMRSERWKP
jgi:Arc/MetJ-type ribon-helix-helix transcriptional regulator